MGSREQRVEENAAGPLDICISESEGREAKRKSEVVALVTSTGLKQTWQSHRWILRGVNLPFMNWDGHHIREERQGRAKMAWENCCLGGSQPAALLV